jgi:ubiquinone biosynthesis protein
VRLRRDIAALLERYAALPIGEVDVAALIGNLFEVLQRHRVRVPPELLLMGKALATVDGMARDLDPTLDPIEAVRPYVLKTWLRRLADPRFLARGWIRAANDFVETAATLPGDLRTIARDLRRGELRIATRHEGLETLVREQARGANRQLLALLIAATTLGSAVLIASGSAGPLPIRGRNRRPAARGLGILAARVRGAALRTLLSLRRRCSTSRPSSTPASGRRSGRAASPQRSRTRS